MRRADKDYVRLRRRQNKTEQDAISGVLVRSKDRTAGSEDAPSCSRKKDTNAPEMKRALKTW